MGDFSASQPTVTDVAVIAISRMLYAGGGCFCKYLQMRSLFYFAYSPSPPSPRVSTLGCLALDVNLIIDAEC